MDTWVSIGHDDVVGVFDGEMYRFRETCVRPSFTFYTRGHLSVYRDGQWNEIGYKLVVWESRIPEGEYLDWRTILLEEGPLALDTFDKV